MPPPASANLTIVGDVHRCWRRGDVDFLERSRPDLTMFVGDLGDEDVAMVREIAALKVPKAVILGNHDAWQSFSDKGVTKSLRESVATLGDDHIAYKVREVPSAGISIVGARPFSWGGQSLRSPEVYKDLYGLHTHRQSAALIVEAAKRAQHRDLLVLAHNGPLGLSRESHDIWGKDFGKPGGDWGDRDLALALTRIAEMGMRVQMVVAGHMHHRLVFPRGSERARYVRAGDTLFLNPAIVPRFRAAHDGVEEAFYLRTWWQAGRCVDIEEIWVDPRGAVRRSTPPQFHEVVTTRPDEWGSDEG
jgi:uncharacterized protein (TIGR04168 family)